MRDSRGIGIYNPLFKRESHPFLVQRESIFAASVAETFKMVDASLTEIVPFVSRTIADNLFLSSFPKPDIAFIVYSVCSYSSNKRIIAHLIYQS